MFIINLSTSKGCLLFYPLGMVSEYLCEPGDVVCQICKRYAGLGSCHAYATKHETSHRTFNEAEHVFDTAADF